MAKGHCWNKARLLYGSNMFNSDRHDTHPLPTLLAGGGAGSLSGGRHVALPTPTPFTNLHRTLLDRIGIGQPAFGDSTGTIDVLKSLSSLGTLDAATMHTLGQKLGLALGLESRA
jgi:hypothetical protein